METTHRTCFAVIDDNVDDCLVMETLLQEDLGVDIHTLPPNTWGEALIPIMEQTDNVHIDVLLLDLHLPNLHGMQLIKLLRNIPALDHTRVIAITVNTSPENVQLARRSGFDGFIGKPLNIKRFSHQMKRILAGEAVWEPS